MQRGKLAFRIPKIPSLRKTCGDRSVDEAVDGAVDGAVKYPWLRQRL